MKYEITPEDKTLIEYDMKTNRTLKHLKNHAVFKFNIGDVLIREDKYSGGLWKPQLAECKLPYKYVYVFENELGIGYIRRLSVNGRKFVGNSTCVLEFDPLTTRFVLDPEYADHILLSPDDADFDAKSRYDEVKKKREQINRKNKKAALNLPDVEAAATFIKGLKVGEKLWYGWNFGNLNKEPIYITQIGTSVKPEDCYFKYTWHAPGAPAPSGYYHNYENAMYTKQLITAKIFLDRPIFLDEVL